MELRLYFYLFLLLFYSCVSTKNYSDHVTKEIKPQINEARDWLIVKAKTDTAIGNKTEIVKHNIIPALLYWRVRTDYNFALDQYSATSILTKYIYSAADSLKLKDSLGDKKIVIEIHQLPDNFLYSERKHTVVFLFLGGNPSPHWTKKIITPSFTDLATKVTISKNENVLSSYPVTVKNEEKEAKNNSMVRKYFNNWIFLDLYVAAYENELKRMAIALVQKIKEKKD